MLLNYHNLIPMLDSDFCFCLHLLYSINVLVPVSELRCRAKLYLCAFSECVN